MAKSNTARKFEGPTLVERPLNKKEADAARKEFDAMHPPLAGSMTVLTGPDATILALNWLALASRRAHLMAPIKDELSQIEDEEARIKLDLAKMGFAAETIQVGNTGLTIDRSMTTRPEIEYRECALRGKNKVAKNQ